ncbi:lipopolysaccharide assembly protein A [Gammaproteobacteria bacterium]
MRRMVAKSYSSIVGALLLLIFASQNTQDVEIRLIIGPPFEMPLILIIVGAFICGFILAIVVRRKNRDPVLNHDEP